MPKITKFPASGANRSLSNLFTTSINASLIPSTDSVIDLGATGPLFWRNLYVDTVIGPTVFNESAADVDFRFEGTSSVNLLFTDAGANRVGIATATPRETFEVIGNFRVDDSASATTKGYRFKTSGSDLDLDGAGKPLFVSIFSSADFGGTQRFYLKFDSTGHNADAYGNWRFQDVIFGNNLFSILPTSTPDEVVVNDAGIDVDFRVEGDNDTSLFRTDGSTDRAGVGIAAPLAKFHVDQSSTTAAVPVLTLDQADVSEEFIRFIGSSEDATLTQSLVKENDVVTATRQGFFKIFVQDDDASDPITDQAYFVPFYILA